MAAPQQVHDVHDVRDLRRNETKTGCAFKFGQPGKWPGNVRQTNTHEDGGRAMNQAWKAKAGQFLPGANLTVLPHWEREALPSYDHAEVSVPGRLHFAVFDFMQMAPGFGGGGLG